MGAKTRVNSVLSKTFGVQIKRTRWSEAKKPEWPDPSPIGMVDHFGKKEITGWVSAARNDHPVRVTVNINGYPVHSTWANVDTNLSTNGKVYGFYLGIKDVWDFCKKGDRLTVRVGDRVLPIQEKGIYRKASESGARDLNQLKTLLSNGYLFNRGGALQLSKKMDMKWQKQMIELYKSVTKVLEENYDISPFLIYGSLLGQVREGGFIGHDDDFDIAYLSTKRTGPAAAKELIAISKTLRKNGFDVELRASAVHVHDKTNPKVRIDLFHLYFNKQNELSFAFGVAGTSQFMRSEWRGLTKGKYANFTVSIPKNAEKLVECIYGASWRTPIVGFNWNHARTRRDRSAIVPHEAREKFNETNRK